MLTTLKVSIEGVRVLIPQRLLPIRGVGVSEAWEILISVSTAARNRVPTTAHSEVGYDFGLKNLRESDN